MSKKKYWRKGNFSMNSGSYFLYLGLFLDALSLFFGRFNISDYIVIPMGVISVILMVYGFYRMLKYDKLVEKGRKIFKKNK